MPWIINNCIICDNLDEARDVADCLERAGKKVTLESTDGHAGKAAGREEPDGPA